MKVFISWSGEASRELAQVLSDWMPNVLQSADPFMSDTDIAKGDPWSRELAAELEATHFGVVCLTPDNKDAPWLHFEAGALSKISAIGRVAPLLFDLTPSDIHGPLARFQHTSFEQEEIRKLLRSINSAAGDGADERFGKAFDALWDELNRPMQAILAGHRTTWGQKSSVGRKPDLGRVEQAVEEILGIVRERRTPLQSTLLSVLQEQRSHLWHVKRGIDGLNAAIESARREMTDYLNQQQSAADLHAHLNQLLNNMTSHLSQMNVEVIVANIEPAPEQLNRWQEQVKKTAGLVPDGNADVALGLAAGVKGTPRGE